MRAGTTHYRDENGSGFEVKFGGGSGQSEKGALCDYITYPRKFITYKWYRPLIAGVLGVVFYMLLLSILMTIMRFIFGGEMQGVIDAVKGGYDTMDVYTASGALLSLGGVALLLPAIALANKAAGKRSFSSYESSRGGWDFAVFFKCMLIGLVVVVLPLVIDYLMEGEGSGVNRFTIAGVVIVTLLGPVQCIAEEYLFRGYIMQTIGAWFKIPVIAIIVQAAVFASMHPYDALGVAEILVSGLMFGTIAWISRGLEAGSAMHICNNMTIFYMTGLGYGQISSDSDIKSFIFSFVMQAVYLLIMILCRKRGMFDRVKKNDAAEYNAKYEAKQAAKAEKKAAKAAKKAAKKEAKTGA